MKMAGMRPTAAPKEPPAIKPKALGKGGLFDWKPSRPGSKRSSYIWAYVVCKIYTKIICGISRNEKLLVLYQKKRGRQPKISGTGGEKTRIMQEMSFTLYVYMFFFNG